ncbi:alpha/beta hydrolase [Streptomyces sp. RerS4]|uniref:alpha/beta fold hydrolase n=1 Tax=Streptomyces sp. RerS4 TaxID=2942449 RepID=UPI00201C0219|nr:alpha/beta hydrolase [Streptomyces sp. RerS4]UQX01229.1 alpha/beta hydrolase [Streptomyces sp. RerS4]
MHNAVVTPRGDRIRWIELPGVQPSRVYLHGLGATSPAYFTASAVHPLLAGRRSLLVDLLGHGHSDRPEDFTYTLEAHADAVARALTAAHVEGAEVIGHSMGGAVAIVLAARHPHLVSRLVLVDANLDPQDPTPRVAGSSGLAAYTEEEFLAGGWAEVRDRVGDHWWSTMRLAGRTALYRSAVHLAAGTTPTMRELLLGLEIPRGYLYPQADGPLDGAEALEATGVAVVPVPDCGHNIMLDNPEGFARATADALLLDQPRGADAAAAGIRAPGDGVPSVQA